MPDQSPKIWGPEIGGRGRSYQNDPIQDMATRVLVGAGTVAEQVQWPESSSTETELEPRKRPEFNGNGTELQPWSGCA